MRDAAHTSRPPFPQAWNAAPRPALKYLCLFVPQGRSAGKLAAMYLPMYLCSVVTITLAVGIALWLIDSVIYADEG